SWILSVIQELTRRSGCKYACWEAEQHGLDLRAIKVMLKKHNSKAMELNDSAATKQQSGTPSPSKKIKREAVNNAERANKEALRQGAASASCDWLRWKVRVLLWGKLPR
ncbi:hypothetical protein CYMTET_16838, partial [Cymbomonas tetramitiformis]